MVYALRHYIKGVKGSGTRDLWVGDYIPSRDEIAEAYGESGKFVVMERGKGIRGMRKVAEYLFESSYSSAVKSEWMPKAFAAEESSRMSVRKEISLSELSDEDLDGLWDSMLETPVDSEDDFQRFVNDCTKVKKEVYRRLKSRSPESGESNETMMSESSGGKSFGYGTIVTAGVVGLVAGAVIQEVRWKKRFDAAEKRMSDLESLIEDLTEKASKAVEQTNTRGSLATHDVLRAFNSRSGY